MNDLNFDNIYRFLLFFIGFLDVLFLFLLEDMSKHALANQLNNINKLLFLCLSFDNNEFANITAKTWGFM